MIVTKTKDVESVDNEQTCSLQLSDLVCLWACWFNGFQVNYLGVDH